MTRFLTTVLSCILLGLIGYLSTNFFLDLRSTSLYTLSQELKTGMNVYEVVDLLGKPSRTNVIDYGHKEVRKDYYLRKNLGIAIHYEDGILTVYFISLEKDNKTTIQSNLGEKKNGRSSFI